VDGELHYRMGGQAFVREARYSPAAPEPVAQRPRQARAVFMHAIPWRVPTRITPRGGGEPFNEWFARGSVTSIRPVPFSINHVSEGGVQIGRVVRLIDGVAWLDAAALVDEGPAGDAFLDGLGDDAGRLPVSVAFQPISSVQYHDGLMRTKVELLEIAVVDTAAYEGAYLYARGSLSTLTALEMAAS
jgi:hypothetical protein